MKVIPHADAASHVDDIVAVIAAGGLACIPIRGAYRVIADVRSEAAITKLAQSKRRAHNRPALVVVTSLAAAKEIVDGTDSAHVKKLAKAFWPGPLTLVLPPSKKLPPKVAKTLSRSTGSIGVRLPDDSLCGAIAKAAPLLVSSANLENKPGASSAAAVRQRFDRVVDIWVDAGELKPEMPSTLIEVDRDEWRIVREGAVTKAAIEAALH